MILAMADLLVVKTDIVLGASMPESVMIWMVSLNQDLAWEVPTSCSTGHLGYKLKASLRGPEIR